MVRRLGKASFGPLVLVLLGSIRSAAAAPDAGAPDAVPRAQEVDFSGEEGLGGDEIQTRDPHPVEFESILPARFRVPEGAPAAEAEPPPRVARRRGGCAGCAVGGAGEGAFSGAWLAAAALAAVALTTARRRAAARRAPEPRRRASRPRRP